MSRTARTRRRAVPPPRPGTNGLLPADDFALVGNVRAVLTWDHGIFADWMVHSLLYAVVGAAAATLLSGGRVTSWRNTPSEAEESYSP
ncbi:hypothetical protein ACWC9U_27085 [Streptomyces sp. 900116325]